MASSDNDDELVQLLVPSKRKRTYFTWFRGRRSRSNREGSEPLPAKRAVTVAELFRYADRSDIALMIVGTLFAAIHGAGWPVLSIIVGGMTNTFIRAENSNFSSPGTASFQTTFSEEYAVLANGINISSAPSSFANLTISPEDFIQNVTFYAIYYSLVGIAMFVTTFVQVACWSYTCERQTSRIRKEFFRSALRLDVAWYDRHPSGELTSKLNDDIERIREGIGDKFSLMIQFCAAFLSGFTIGFFYNWRLTLVMISLTPLLAGSSAWAGSVLAFITKIEQLRYSKAGAVAQEVFSSIKTVYAFNGQRKELLRYHAALEECRTLGYRRNLIIGCMFSSLYVSMFSMYALAFWYGSKLIADDPFFDRGTVFTVFFAVMTGSMSLGSALPQFTCITVARGTARSIFDIIDTKPSIEYPNTQGLSPSAVNGKLEFHDVCFAYPSRNSVKVLKSLTFSVMPGQRVALVGSSGCGKSTVINLLIRFYDCSSGKIIIDGFDLKSINVRTLRHLVGLVSQEPVLFDGSIEENIRLGNPALTTEEIIEAAKVANAYAFIMNLPQQFATKVGQQGMQLSGGQKQRIAIARALVRNPKILLLDEATSALDTQNEEIVQEALNRAQKGRTTIIVAHRLSTIKDVDKIFVLANGSLVESGTHRELMDKRSTYYKMVLAQQVNFGCGYTSGETPLSSNDEDRAAGSATSTGDTNRSYPERARRRRSRRLSKYGSLRELLRTVDSDVPPAEQPASNTTARDIMTLRKQAEEENVKPAKLATVIRMASKCWKCWALGCVGSLMSAVVMPAFALFFSQMFYVYTQQGKELEDGAKFWSLMLFLLGVANGLSVLIAVYFFGKASEDFTLDLRLRTFASLLHQDISYFDDDRHSSGKICTRLATDVPNVRAVIGYRASYMMTAALSMVVAVVIAFVFGWKLAFVISALLPVMIIATFFDFRQKLTRQLRDAKLLEEAGRIFNECTENIRTVKSLGQEQHFYQRFKDRLMIPYEEALRQSKIYAGSYSVSQSFIFFIYAAAFRYGGYLVSVGEMDPLQVYRVFFALTFCGVAIGQACAHIPDLVKALISGSLTFHTINLQPDIDNCSPAGLKPELKGKIGFHEVHFTYPTRKTVRVLRGLTFKTNAGMTLAIVGPSGCGKTTIANLIERYYDPTLGKVMTNGFDIRIVNIAHLRQNIGLVSQEPVLFNCSIRNNITYGLDQTVTHDKVVTAAKVANIHDFILTLPNGYNTLAGEKGIQLSGGQKQRIAIARALIRNPKLLLLDEATSAMDTENEQAVQDAIEKAKSGRTCIIIAHRLSTVQNADWIIVLRDGRIAEEGKHKQLMNKRGIYYRMIKMQDLIEQSAQ